MRENLISRKALSPVTPTKLAHQQKSSQYLDALLQPFLDPRLAPQKHHREIESLKPTEYLNIPRSPKRRFCKINAPLTSPMTHRPAHPFFGRITNAPLVAAWSCCSNEWAIKQRPDPTGHNFAALLVTVQIGQFHLLLLIEKLSQHHSPICFLRRNLSSSALASIK